MKPTQGEQFDPIAEAEARISKAKSERAWSLNLGDLELTELPASLGDLPWLEALSLGDGTYDENNNYILGKETLHIKREFTDLHVLSKLQSLTHLSLHGCQGISDLSPLADFPSLQSLDLSRTAVSNLSSLSQLVSLKRLHLRDCAQLGSLQPLKPLKELRSLDIYESPSDLTFELLDAWPRLEELFCTEMEGAPKETLSQHARDMCLPALQDFWPTATIDTPPQENAPLRNPSEATQTDPSGFGLFVRPNRFPIKFANYELLEEMPPGGMSWVYKAREISTEEIVVIKMPNRLPLIPKHVSRRFQREINSTKRSKVAGVIRVRDSGTEKEMPYFATRYVDGESGRNFFPVETIPLEERLDAFSKLVGIVAEMHDTGQFHRDLKPSNVIIEDGCPVVIDLGLSKFDQEQTVYTHTGDVPNGTIPYMAPEMFDLSSGITPSEIDVYALGIILCEILTGQRPHDFSTIYTPEEKVQFIRSEKPRLPSEIKDGISLIFDTLVERCLIHDRRFASAGELRDELHLARNPENKSTDSLSSASGKPSRYNLQNWKGPFSGRKALKILVIIGIFILSTLIITIGRMKDHGNEKGGRPAPSEPLGPSAPAFIHNRIPPPPPAENPVPLLNPPPKYSP